MWSHPNIILISFTLTQAFTTFDFDTINIPDALNPSFNGEFRNINGTNNNINNPNWGTMNAQVVRCVDPQYGDGFNSLNGQDRPNPRVISNTLSSQIPEEDPKFINDRHLTQFAWQWGQFIDHDVTLISEDKTDNDIHQDIDISVPCGDTIFDPQGTCSAEIEVFRTFAFNNSGSNINNPRNQFNDITAFIDASMIYGSDEERALLLREGVDGKMATSESDFGEELLPKNVFGLLNEPNMGTNFFVGGDVRVNEQMGLLAMHTLFIRAHNKIAEMIENSVRINNPYNTETEIDEKIYQYAKLILNAIEQKITYKDWLPTLFGHTAFDLYIGPYQGYDEGINPGICSIFASSAFRFGHTLLPQKLPIRGSDCRSSESYGDDLELKDAFFTPEIMQSRENFVEGIFNGFGCTKANEIDTRITESVRNFLFQSAQNENGNPIFGILDLISINIQRGRDHGLPDYNTVRQGLGLTKVEKFEDLSSNQMINEEFRNLYEEDIDNIDLFMGGLVEDHFIDGSFGELLSKIVLEQFKRLRDGDRFYYENYIQNGDLLSWIESITFKDILENVGNVDFSIMNKKRKKKRMNGDDTIMFQNVDAVSIFDIFKEDKMSKKEIA